MTTVHKSVLWTLAVCVFGLMAVHVLIVRAPGVAQAWQPRTDPSGATPLPEDEPGVGNERVAPAEEGARVFHAVCLDQGLPLVGVIVDILRETPGESVFDPRVESFGRTKTKRDGKFSITLPRIQGKTEEREIAAMYILYFTAPGRPIKSLIVKNETELPTEILIPHESKEEVYLPMHHLVLAKPDGISVSPMLSAIRGFSTDGQPIRVSQLVDYRNEGKTPASRYGATSGMAGGDPTRKGMARPRSEQMIQQPAQDQIRAARQRLTDAKTDEEKQFARAQLRKLLAEIFAQDMQMREKQAAEIESRLTRLRQQYQAREQVKDEIIDLQLKVIEQDAAGLSFPGGTSADSRTDPATSATPTGEGRPANEREAQDANPGAPPSDSERGAMNSIPDRIKSLGLKLGNETKTSLDRRYPMRITGKEGEVTIKAGETKLIELPKPTLAVQWQCGDFKPEAIDDVEPFDYVLVEWNSDGHVTWSCYRSPAASTLVPLGD